MKKNIFALCTLTILSLSQAHAGCMKGQICPSGPTVITAGPPGFPTHPMCRMKCSSGPELMTAVHNQMADSLNVDPSQIGTSDYSATEKLAVDETHSTYDYAAQGTVQTAQGPKAFACKGTLATVHEAMPNAPETKDDEKSSVACGKN